MKDEITIGLNGKIIASFGIELKGRTIDVEKVGSFVVSTGSDEDKDVMNIRMGCILVDEGMVKLDEKKVSPIEPMVIHPVVAEKKDPIVETPVQKQMEAISNPVPPAPAYNEIPIRTRKPRGPNKPKEEVVEKSVFDRPAEENGEFVPLEEVAKELKIAPVVETIVERKDAPTVEEKKVPTVSTPARINELAKLVKMWCKASGLHIDYVTADRLKAEAFDIVEFDSDETIATAIKEAAMLIKG